MTILVVLVLKLTTIVDRAPLTTSFSSEGRMLWKIRNESFTLLWLFDQQIAVLATYEYLYFTFFTIIHTIEDCLLKFESDSPVETVTILPSRNFNYYFRTNNLNIFIDKNQSDLRRFELKLCKILKSRTDLIIKLLHLKFILIQLSSLR